MAPFVEYLLKLSVSLAAVSLFYQLVLRRLTFYNWNRWYFLIYTTLSFFIPLIDITQSDPALFNKNLIARIPSIHQLTSSPAADNVYAPAVEPVGYENWVLLAILAGTVIMMLRFLLHVVFYIRVRRNARLVSNEDVKIYHLEKDVPPFSFGNSIFYNPDLHQPEELRDIILHEYVHVRQKHSFDVIWSEILCIVNWYNPFSWFLRYSIRQNLEFIADRKVLENDVDARQYQYLLLKVAGVPEYRIANQFSFSSLKQRIVMMNKGKTPQLFLSLFLFSLPLIALLLAIFRNDIREFLDNSPVTEVIGKGVGPNLEKKAVYVAGLILDGETKEPIAGLPLKISYNDRYLKTITTNARGFYYQKVIVPKDEQFLSFERFKRSKGKAVNYPMQSIMTSYEGADFVQFSMGDSRSVDEDRYGSFPVIYAIRQQDYSFRPDFYGVNKAEFFGSYQGTDVAKGIFQSLTKAAPAFTKEHDLKLAFKKAHPFSKSVITKFRNAYFNRDKQLIGYESRIEFYLNGEKASYLQVNEAFKDYPYMLKPSNEYKTWEENGSGLYKRIAYLTVPLYKDAAPRYLVKGNIEWKDIREFDLAALKKDPYFLDGFRQIYGTGSNMVPEKAEIRKVALFKGKLARYYAPNCDKIWWIETRPEPEVFERPDLAMVK